MEQDLPELVKRISKVGKSEIDIVFQTAFARLRELHPDWDIHYFSLPKRNSPDKCKYIDALITFLQKKCIKGTPR